MLTRAGTLRRAHTSLSLEFHMKHKNNERFLLRKKILSERTTTFAFLVCHHKSCLFLINHLSSQSSNHLYIHTFAPYYLPFPLPLSVSQSVPSIPSHSLLPSLIFLFSVTKTGKSWTEQMQLSGAMKDETEREELKRQKRAVKQWHIALFL